MRQRLSDREAKIAVREAHQIQAITAYFDARPAIYPYPDQIRLSEAMFKLGWDAAVKEAENQKVRNEKA